MTVQMNTPEDKELGGIQEHEDSDPLIGFEHQVAHLSASYSNSQAFVRFADAKAGAVIGGVPVFIGMLAGVFAWMCDTFELDTVIRQNPSWPPAVVVTALLIYTFVLVILGWNAISAAFNAIRPRCSDDASILFPFESPEFAARLNKFITDGDESEILEDYRRQLARMGQIARHKHESLNRAFTCLKGLLAVVVCGLGVLIVVSGIACV